jgi:NAD(P)-dependent dehydrogenase (short-subunit alcohol dehydrogenase family)
VLLTGAAGGIGMATAAERLRHLPRRLVDAVMRRRLARVRLPAS